MKSLLRRSLCRISVVCVFVSVFLLFQNVSAQDELIINPAKGSLDVNVPVHKFDMIDFKIVVGLSYSARGYKPAAEDALVGWKFYGGGKIQRTLRGLPDEKAWSSGDTRKGWLGGSLYSIPTSFTPADDNNESSCTDEQTNNTFFSSNYDYTKDAEPDIFDVDAPGLSCRLMIDNSGNFRSLSNDDVKVQFLTDYYSNKYFIITTSGGIEYTFNQYSTTTRKSLGSAGSLFSADYYYYTTQLTYVDTWYLTKIRSNNSAGYAHLVYDYVGQSDFVSYESSKLSSPSSPANAFQLTISGRRYLKTIENSLGGKIELPGTSDFPSTIEVYNSTEYGHPADRVISYWTKAAFNPWVGGAKEFITILYEQVNDCKKQLYMFDYYGLGGTYADFPVSDTSKRTDAWGYFNDKPNSSYTPQIYIYPAFAGKSTPYRPYPISGYSGTNYTLGSKDVTVNENKIMMGTMSKITYPTGGSSTFEYEPNSFIDPDGNVEIKGGGLRLKKIKHFDGWDTSKVITKEFIYKDDNNNCSGIINVLPTFAIFGAGYSSQSYNTVTTNNGLNTINYWSYLTTIASRDLYGGASDVTYSQVTVKENGNGKIKNVYAVPYTLPDSAYTTKSYTAEACSGSSSGYPTRTFYQYPFAYVEHRSGQQDLLKEFTYDKNDSLLKKKEYTYEELYSSPVKIYGVARDNNFGLLQFSKYGTEIYGNLITQEKETVYNSDLTTDSVVTQTDYDNNAFNRHVRSITTTNSDNSQMKKSYIYSGDFASLSSGDFTSNDELKGIYQLNLQNLTSTVLEETSYMKESGGSFKVIASAANLYYKNPSMVYNYPSLHKVKELKNINGLTDFAPMALAGSAPNKTLATDSRYIDIKVYDDYNSYNMPSMGTEKRVTSTFINDYILRLPLLQINGAEKTNFAFSSFDRQDADVAFTIENPYYTKLVEDIYANYGYTLLANDALNRSITRKAADKFYKVALLCKAGSATRIRIQINGTTVDSITIGASANYKFYEKEVNMSSTSAGSNTVRLLAVGTVIVDNVIFYPSDAQFTATSYQYTVGKTLEMNSSGQCNVYDYDNKVRLVAVKDLEGNIKEAKLYNDQSSNTNNMLVTGQSLYTDIWVLNPLENFVNRTMEFKAHSGCIPGVKYIWNFGDGSGNLQTYNAEITHVYTSTGTYTVTLTIQHPEFTQYVTTKNQQILATPTINATICLSGISRRNVCYGYPTYYSNCSGHIPGQYDAPNSSKFYVTASGCPNNDYEYMWERSDDGVNYYMFDYTSTGETEVFNDGYTQENFYVRCTVYSPTCQVEKVTSAIYVQYNCYIY